MVAEATELCLICLFGLFGLYEASVAIMRGELWSCSRVCICWSDVCSFCGVDVGMLVCF